MFRDRKKGGKKKKEGKVSGATGGLTGRKKILAEMFTRKEKRNDLPLSAPPGHRRKRRGEETAKKNRAHAGRHYA